MNMKLEFQFPILITKLILRIQVSLITMIIEIAIMIETAKLAAKLSTAKVKWIKI